MSMVGLQILLRRWRRIGSSVILFFTFVGMSSYCEDCGCKVYSGHCVNCHEETFIAEQYRDL